LSAWDLIKFVRSALNSMLVCVKWCWCRNKIACKCVNIYKQKFTSCWK
jgi:hypothetical protein